MIRVRFAPSPTGPLHMGGLRTALYNYLLAKQCGGKFILRIEDTDQSRTVEYAENYIIESLKWLKIIPDEGFEASERDQYKQSKRREIYKEYAYQLIEKGFAYYAFDTPEELNEIRQRVQQPGKNWQYDSISRQYMKNSLTLPEDETKRLIEQGTPYVIRIKTERNQEVKINDLIRGPVIFNTNVLDDKILLKSDGMPTYHLANVVDDHLMNISHVIRGEEWLPSTPIHVLLYEYLGIKHKMPEFAHLPLLLRPDGNGKLSKRDGEKYGFPVFPLSIPSDNGTIVPGYRELGFLPEAFINVLALLGWNPGTEKEIYTMEELINDFSIEKVSKSGAKFNYQKCLWINHEHLKKSETNYIKEYIISTYKDISFDDIILTKVIETDKKRVNLLTEILDDYRRAIDFNYVKNNISKNSSEINVKILSNFYEFIHTKINDINGELDIEKVIKLYIKDNKIKFQEIGIPLRIATFGIKTGPSISEIYYILGKTEFFNRVKTITDDF
ncbi:glutamate--tRNA ligase [Schleiferia thermophila]|jgi:glutamyl-tRNA synthetase|uniref:Glutamate--tRNA ligase n=1 Tax=Schleiferia thermophila TaxID=884107 RepID=A0A369A396_9FLAO|nr:glutamate--tRNA ligase [Schleiferia thermophila]KFD38523.1 glutamyl-tRNA synthetase [Schleiferia thermophila str. Yellowstone]PMB31376.1 glutamate--tRNA ligase [Fischerella thermalis CCMEE 5319]RCX03651.1 glutamyl-tRNA synthetase [Schleiferia thermophila]